MELQLSAIFVNGDALISQEGSRTFGRQFSEVLKQGEHIFRAEKPNGTSS